MSWSAFLLAATEAEPSKVPFYICGGALALWAVVVSLFGIRRADFPATERAARGVMAISAVLVVAAAATAVTSS